MPKRSRSSGSPINPGRGPGWFSRSPAMAALAVRLSGLESTRVFRGLRAMIQPAASIANTILARLAAREPVHPRWQGRLHLERFTQAGHVPPQSIFRRLVERLGWRGGRSERQRAFRTLGLAESLLESLEPFSTLTSIDSEAYEPGMSWSEVEEAIDPNSTRLPENRPPVSSPAVTPFPTTRRTHGAPKSQAAFRTTVKPLPAPPKQSDWPFQLIQPRSQTHILDRPTQQEMRRIGRAEPASLRISYSAEYPAARTQGVTADPTGHAQLIGHPASQALPQFGETAPLQVRPMTLQLVQMPVTTVRIPAALTGQAPAQTGQTEHGLEWGFARPDRMATRRKSQTKPEPVPASFGKHSPHSTLGDLAQLRTPATMLGLTSAQPNQPGTGTASIPHAQRSLPPQSGEREWPLFGILRQLGTRPPEASDSSALQHLRRMWPESQLAPAVSAAAKASTALGPGEPLTPQLRRMMQAHLGHELGDVRLHVSPIAQMLRAEAFTSGQQVVFAPGRLDPSTPGGLALLGHELTHLGQPLAFKTESSAGALPEDSSERLARQQEEQIRSVIEKGWPQPSGREYRRSPQPHIPGAASAQASSVTAVQRSVHIDEMQTEATEQQDAAPAASPDGQASTQTEQRSSGTPAQNGGQAQRGTAGGSGLLSPAMLDALVRQVYNILKDRLRAERTRHELYRR